MVWDDQVVSGNSIGVNFKNCRWLTWFSGREILCKEVIRRNRYGQERRINERGNNETQCFTFPYNGCKAEIVCAYAGSLCKHTLGSPTSPTSPLSSNRYLTASWSSFLLPTFLSPHILGPLFASRKYHTLLPPPKIPTMPFPPPPADTIGTVTPLQAQESLLTAIQIGTILASKFAKAGATTQ